MILWRLNNECCEIKTLDLGPKVSKFGWKYYQSIRSIDRWKQPKHHKCLSCPCRKMEPQANHHLFKLTSFLCWSRDTSCFKIEDLRNLDVQPSLQRAKWKSYNKDLWNIIWKLNNIYQNSNYLNVGIFILFIIIIIIIIIFSLKELPNKKDSIHNVSLLLLVCWKFY